MNDRLWKLSSLGHTEPVASVALSADGRRALTGSGDYTVRIWDAERLECTGILLGHQHAVLCVAITPDGRFGLSGSIDYTIRYWDLERQRCIATLKPEGAAHISWVGFGRDESIGYSDDRALRVWDLKARKCLRTLRYASWGGRARVSGDGRHVLTVDADRGLRLWDLERDACAILDANIGWVPPLAWSADETIAVTAAKDHTLRVWDLASLHCIGVLEGHTGNISTIALSGDGKHALSAGYDRTLRLWNVAELRCIGVLEGHGSAVTRVAIDAAFSRAISAAEDRTLRSWDLCALREHAVAGGLDHKISSAVIRGELRRMLTGSEDGTLRLWDIETGECLAVVKAAQRSIQKVALGLDGRTALATIDRPYEGEEGRLGSFRIWDLHTGQCRVVVSGHEESVHALALTPDGRLALSGSFDHTVRAWDAETGKCLAVLEGHTGTVLALAISRDGTRLLSASADRTLRLWDLETFGCLGTLEGHTDAVYHVQFSEDGRWAISAADRDDRLRLWSLRRRRCAAELRGGSRSEAVALDFDRRRAISSDGHAVRLWDLFSRTSIDVLDSLPVLREPIALAFSADGRTAYGCGPDGVFYSWDVPPLDVPVLTEDASYTNAKILIIGDTGVGKTALARRLTDDRFDAATLSTDGVVSHCWATRTTLEQLPEDGGADRELWLWDFAGQSDYRLVHQLYMDRAAVAVLVFDPQQDDLLDRLERWDRAVERAAAGAVRKILVAGRIDRGRPTVPREELARFCREHGYVEYLETSALDGTNCEVLRDAIIRHVPWKSISWAISSEVFHLLREEIVLMKEEGVVLLRARELATALRSRLPGERFTDDDVRAVIALLAGPGVVWQLAFGDFVLLQPEVVDSYAAAVIRSVRTQPDELGCIAEEDVLAGKLDYGATRRLPPEEEQIVLRAMHHTLVERGLCLREHTDRGTLLVFPAYLKQERPELEEHPPTLVTYCFEGFAEEVFAALVTRLQHTEVFRRDRLWRFAADYRTEGGRRLGLKMTPREHGIAELELYFDTEVPPDLKVTFIRWVHERLHESGRNVERRRSYVCDRCHQPVESHRTIAARRATGWADVFCPNCGARVPLDDGIEQRFASNELGRLARRLDARASRSIDNESKELQLVGHVYVMVAEAGHIYRQYTNSDHGIDGEIEFKDADGRATGVRLYLQLKSGDSYLRRRRKDDAEIFTVRKPRWIDYWRRQAYPVMLVVRTSNGEIRWMNVTSWLARIGIQGESVRQIVFEGEALTPDSVRSFAPRD